MRKYLPYLKVFSYISIPGSIYVIYKTKDFYILFVFAVILLVVSHIAEYIYDRFLQEKDLYQKRRMTIEALSKSWLDQEEVIKIKENMSKTSEVIAMMNKKLEKYDRLFEVLSSKILSDKELEGKQITEPVISLDKAVGWNEEDKKIAQKVLAVSNPVLEKEAGVDNRILEILREEGIENTWFSLLQDADKNKVEKFLKLYRFAKDNHINFDVNSLLHGVFIKENDEVKKIEAYLYKEEKNVDINKFIAYVKILALSQEPFEYEGKTYKKVVFVYKDCVYVNYVVLKSFFEDYTDDKEALFAFIFSDYLCPSIDWRKGFIKRSFKLVMEGSTYSVPFIALKKEVVDKNLPDTDGVEIKL